MPKFTISTNGLLKLLATLRPNNAAGPHNKTLRPERPLRIDKPSSLTCLLGEVWPRQGESDQQPFEGKGYPHPWATRFKDGLSCDTQLIVFHHDLLTMLTANHQVDCIVMDFSKVSHRRLLTKLYRYGIWGENLDWIEDLLRDCFQ